jgi:hypothetical protein
MQVNQINLTVGMLRKVSISCVIERIENKLDLDYSTEFSKLADQFKEGGDQELFSVCCLITAITSMRLCPSNTRAPFSPMFVIEDRRGALPEDITDQSLDALSEWLPEIVDPELKARIADLLWLRRRKPEYAHTAISAYVDSAKVLEDPDHWPPCTDRIERGLRLSAMYRRQTSEHFTKTVDYIESILEKYAGSDSMCLSVKLLNLLADFKYGDPNKYTDLAISIAEGAHSAGNWHKAENAWEVAEKWAIILKNISKRETIIANWAETYAEQAKAADGGLASSTWMQKSIELYKRVSNSRARREELYQQLRRYQEKTLEQMSAMKGEKIDLTESIEASIKAVSGKSFENAIFNLAFAIASIPDYEDIKRQAQEESNKYFFSNIFGAVHIDRDGLIIASVPASIGVTDDDQGKAIWAKMLRTVEIHHRLHVFGAIEPAIREINLEHHCSEEMVFTFIRDNPFIPHGFEYLYAKGLHAGLTGDFIVATHLLIPQLENCLRHILQENGVETTTLNTFKLQERLRIGAILEHPKLSEVIGINMVLDFQALLVERKYGNLRNEVSHGLIPSDYFYQPSIVYLWWLALRFCLLPFINPRKAKCASGSAG